MLKIVIILAVESYDMIGTIGTSELIQPVAKHDNWRAEERRASNK